MILYETNSSPFFVANKTYCEAITSKLKIMNLDCSGFCNSYGYSIDTTFKRNSLLYNIKFYKSQTTENGVIIPINSNDYSGTEIIVTGLNKKFNVTIGKSSLRRLFSLKKFKKQFPAPYFISFNYLPDNNFIDDLVEKMQNSKISKFKLNNGRLVCKMHIAIDDPLDLIANIEMIIKKWV